MKVACKNNCTEPECIEARSYCIYEIADAANEIITETMRNTDEKIVIDAVYNAFQMLWAKMGRGYSVLIFIAMMAPTTCYAADVGRLIQSCIGWGTKGFVVVTLVVYSFIRWILCDLLGSIWSDTNRQRIDAVLKVLSASIVLESVFGLFSGTLDKMGF